VLDPKRPIREADIGWGVGEVPELLRKP
jgi:hypothetical protein